MAKHMTRRHLLGDAARCAALAPFFTLAACGPGPETTDGFELRGHTMGTTYRIRVQAPPPALDRLGLHAEVAAVLGRVDRQMSVWRSDAELARVNAAPAGSWIGVSPETCLVVQAALGQQQASGGAFDPTIGALVDLWGFGPARAPRAVPDDRRVEALRRACGPASIGLRSAPPALCRRHPEVRLDLSSIAQGHAVDALAARLEGHGLRHVLIEVGGELRAAGRVGAERPWRVAVERPAGAARRPLCVVALVDAAIGTSGVSLRSFASEGRRYAHILDPRSGRPVEHRLLSVSVIASSALRADAEATTLLVLGPQAGPARAASEGLAALFAWEEDGAIRISRTPEFAACVLEEGGPA